MLGTKTNMTMALQLESDPMSLLQAKTVVTKKNKIIIFFQIKCSDSTKSNYFNPSEYLG